MFSSSTPISWHKTEWGQKNHHKYTQDMKIYIYIFIIYIKCLLFNPICTLFTRRLGNEVLRNEAPLHRVNIQIFSRRKKTRKKVTKIPPAQKRKVTLFQHKLPQANSSINFHKFSKNGSPSQLVVVHRWSAEEK